MRNRKHKLEFYPQGTFLCVSFNFEPCVLEGVVFFFFLPGCKTDIERDPCVFQNYAFDGFLCKLLLSAIRMGYAGELLPLWPSLEA